MKFEIFDNFLSDEECDKWVKFIQDQIESLTDPIKKRRDYKFNEWLPELSNSLAEKLGYKGSGRITFGKYIRDSPGLARHTDLIIERNAIQTGVVYLNSLTDSGQTVLFLADEREEKILPKKGRLLLFDLEIPHMGSPTTEEKYVLIFRVVK